MVERGRAPPCADECMTEERCHTILMAYSGLVRGITSNLQVWCCKFSLMNLLLAPHKKSLASCRPLDVLETVVMGALSSHLLL